MNGNEMKRKTRSDEDALMHMDDVEVVDFVEMNLNDAIVIAGFPSIGLVSTIVSNYLIDALSLEQIGALNSAQFPTLSVVHTGEPLSPVRIYAGTLENGRKIVVFVSEFKPKSHLINSLSNTVIKWVRDKGCNLLISPEGMVVEGKDDKSSEKDNVGESFAIGSTENARAMIRDMNIPQFKNGIIAGVSGVLLNIGKQTGFDVIAVLAEAHPNIPDAGAGASALTVIATLLGVEINVGPLYEEAERIEKQLQKFHKQAKPMTSGQSPQPGMYG